MLIATQKLFNFGEVQNMLFLAMHFKMKVNCATPMPKLELN